MIMPAMLSTGGLGYPPSDQVRKLLVPFPFFHTTRDTEGAKGRR